MILKDDFFSIVETHADEGNLRFRVRLNPEHFIFRVHFVGNPVVPGVCLIQMATELLESHLNCRLLLDSATSIKFKRPIHPAIEPEFAFSKVQTEENGLIKTVFMIQDEEAQYAKMSLLYKKLS